MTFEIGYVLCCLVFMIWALIADKLRPGLILMTVVVLMMCGKIIDPKEALMGFSNKGMITVALLYLVSEGVRKSGILEQIIHRMLPQTKATVSRASMRFLPVISFISAFLNNTPVVVIFAPMLKNWALKMKLPPTKFLIPLSYATILGGMCTLIGTSTNIVVDGLMQDNGYEEMHMFDLGKVGIFIALVGLFYLIFLSKYLLPEHRQAEVDIDDKQQAAGHITVEAMLSTRFPGLGKTLRQFDFYAHFGATVRGIRRSGEMLGGDWMNTTLTRKDTLILDTVPRFMEDWGESKAFWMLNVVGHEPDMTKSKKYLAVVLLALMIIGATVGELPAVKAAVPHFKLDMFFFAFVTTVIMAWTGMFNQRRYTKFISWDVLITIACAFAISKGMQNSGFADLIAGQIKQVASMARHSVGGIYIVMAALYLITNLFTELITNNAAAALAFPLAVSISQQLGCDPMPFFVCICIAASAAFSTPIGYQTNLIVQGVGGYKFTDYVKVGLPLNIICFVLSVFLIPHIF